MKKQQIIEQQLRKELKKFVAEQKKRGLAGACWPGYTAYGFKNKGGESVPACAPDKKKKTAKTKKMSETKKPGLYANVNRRKKLGISRSKNHPLAPSEQAWKDAAKTAKK